MTLIYQESTPLRDSKCHTIANWSLIEPMQKQLISASFATTPKEHGEVLGVPTDLSLLSMLKHQNKLT